MDLPVMRAIGRNVAKTRHLHGLTRERLAGQIGVSVDAIFKLEHGLHVPRFKTLLDLSRELDIPLRDLLDQQNLADERNDENLADERNDDRARLERRGHILLHDLSDEFLALAVEQLSALAKRDRPLNRES